MLTKCAMLGATVFLTGCVQGLTGPRASQLDGELVIFAELSIDHTESFDLETYAAPGPTLVAGDDIALQWAASHRIVSYAAADGAWHSTIVYLD